MKQIFRKQVVMKLIASLLFVTLTAWPQTAADNNKPYKTKEGRDGVAKTLDNPNRDKNQKPEEIIAAMNLPPGSTVADIGTGTGYMLPFLSKAVGPNGRVFGEDIAPDFLDRARAKVASDNLANVTLVLGTETSPTLPSNAVNNILILDVYHHFDYPDKMLANISSALKPGGHLFIVDFYKKDRPDHIRIERDDVVKEISSNGFHLVKTIDHTGNNQYMLTFEKR